MKEIPVDSAGILISCHRNKEKQARNEVLAMLDETTELSLEEELAMLRKKRTTVMLGDCLFFLKIDAPLEYIDQMINSPSKFIYRHSDNNNRLLPMEYTFAANKDNIKKFARILISRHFENSVIVV
jgi:hypothetical protein